MTPNEPTLEQRITYLENDLKQLDEFTLTHRIITWASLLIGILFAFYSMIESINNSKQSGLETLDSYFASDLFYHVASGANLGWAFMYAFIASFVLRGLYRIYLILRS